MPHSRLPLLICNLPQQQWEAWPLPPTIQLLHCFIPENIHSVIKIVNPYSCRSQLYQLGYSAYAQFLLPLVLQTLLISSHLGQQLTTHPFNEIIPYICNTLRIFDHIRHSILGFLNLLNIYIFNLHTLKFTFCTVKFSGF